MDESSRKMAVCYYLEDARQRIVLVIRRLYIYGSELSKALQSIEEAMKIIGCGE